MKFRINDIVDRHTEISVEYLRILDINKDFNYEISRIYINKKSGIIFCGNYTLDSNYVEINFWPSNITKNKFDALYLLYKLNLLHS